MDRDESNFKKTILTEGKGIFTLLPTTKRIHVLMMGAGGSGATNDCDGDRGNSSLFGDYEVKGGKGGQKPYRGGFSSSLLDFNIVNPHSTYDYIVAYSDQKGRSGSSGIIIIEEYDH